MGGAERGTDMHEPASSSMAHVNGRSLAEVRRYDLFKLAVAVALFLNWVFFCDGGLRLPDAADAQMAIFEEALAPDAGLPEQPLSLRFVWRATGVRVEGRVPDADARAALFDAAVLALGARDRVDDALQESPAATVAPWLARFDEFVEAHRPLREGLVTAVHGRKVVVFGEVDDEAAKAALERRVVRFFGPRFVIDSQLTVKPLPVVTAAGSVGPDSAVAAAGGPDAAGAVAAAPGPGAGGAAGGPAGGAAPDARTAPPAGAATPASPPQGAAQVPHASAPPRPAVAAAPLADDAPLALPAVVAVRFGEGSARLPADAAARLAQIVRHARARKDVRVFVSGFHSRTGSAAVNARLARLRAVAVRDLLVRLGVPAARIVLDKPRDTLGGSDDAHARRVEVALRP